MNKKVKIILQGLTYDVNLGWPKEERVEKQTIVMDVIIAFLNEPAACKSDILEDTYCYKKLIEQIGDFLNSKQFRLIERLGFEVQELIKAILPFANVTTVNITKQPAIANLTGGVLFSYGD